MKKFLVFLLVLFSINSSAKIITHKVKKNETLALISKFYYNTTNYWYLIKNQNRLHSSKIEIKQELEIYIPNSSDWPKACKNIARERMKKFNILNKDFVENFAWGVYRAIEDNFATLTPMQSFYLCKTAIATAEQESMYEFAIGSVGEIGIWQFRISTVKYVLKLYGDKKDYTDKEIVKNLLDEKYAAKIFTMYFYSLYKHYKSLWMSWYKYNGIGEHAKLYADKIVKRFSEIEKIPISLNELKIQTIQEKFSIFE